MASQILRIFIDEIEKQLKKSCDGITDDAKLGAVSFIQRFGSRLNLHIGEEVEAPKMQRASAPPEEV